MEPIHHHGAHWPRLLMQANYLDEVTHNPFAFAPGEGVTVLSPSDSSIEDRQRTVEDLRREYFKSADFIGEVVAVSDAPLAYKALAARQKFSVEFDWNNKA